MLFKDFFFPSAAQEPFKAVSPPQGCQAAAGSWLAYHSTTEGDLRSSPGKAAEPALHWAARHEVLLPTPGSAAGETALCLHQSPWARGLSSKVTLG